MIDERHEELAALHALDLLEGAERTQFESAVVADPALAKLVAELREASTSFAHTARAAEPPAALRARILASAGTSQIEAPRAKIISFPTLLAWAAAAQTRIASLQQDLQTQGDLANFKITTLASLLKNSPQAIAVAVWNPAKQEGVLKVDKLPALAADKSYQLWVVDPQYKNPVDGGVFTVDPQTGEQRVKFTGKQPIAAIAAFAVTLERKGGVPKAEGPFVLLGK